MAKKSKAAINFEYGALRFFCALVNAIPYPLAMSAAKGIAAFAFDILGFQRKRTIDRISTAFPEKTPREVRAIARRSLANVLQSAVEMIRAPHLDKRWMDRHVVDGQMYKDRLQELVDEGNGVVIMVPHSGNWYMAAWSMAKYGLPLFALAAPQRNPKIDAWMKRQYGDIEVLDRSEKSTLSRIKDKLKSGRAFAILPDLRVPSPDVDVGFLGGRANVSHAGAMFAVRCGSPIVVAAMHRENGKHVFNHLATLRPDANAADPKAEAARLTREAMTLIDGEVRARPGEWYWYNKRWILQPV